VPNSNKQAKSPFVFLVTLAVLVIATLVVATSYFLRPSIELELKNKLLNNFASLGFNNTTIHISGRDITLHGAVKNKTEAMQAENTAKEIWGVREVDNQLLIKNHSIE